MHLQAVYLAPQHEPDFFLRGTWAEELDRTQRIKDLSNNGDVLGVSSHPWLWSQELGLRSIGDVSPLEYAVSRVNDHHQVAGFRFYYFDSGDCGGERAFMYDDTAKIFRPIDDGPDDIAQNFCGRYSEAMGINDRGQVVGIADAAIGGDTYPFVWTAASGRKPLRNADPKKIDIQPLDINNRGQVVGVFQYTDGPILRPWRFFYWDAASGVVDIQDLLDTSDPLTAQVSFGTDDTSIQINDRGVISVPGRLNGGPGHWFMLYPQ